MKKVIAIDGPSGSGKSTVAKLLAKKLGFDYLDTGALYRAVALNLIQLGFDDSATDNDILSALKNTEVKFRDGRILLNNKDVTQEIRKPDAGHYASVFSARKPVREYLLSIQRDASKNSALVAEGRDMTTVVFPDAYKKFFLDASVEERTKRRTLELVSSGFRVNENKIRSDIIQRDDRDACREIAPLKRSSDAYFIDSSDLSIEDVLNKMMLLIEENLHKKDT